MFEGFPKIPRLFRDCVITEKIDGTNAAVHVLSQEEFETGDYGVDCALAGDYMIVAQSRKRFISPDDDNFGFARWVYGNAQELGDLLGYGLHFGEWWGSGIQRRYGLDEKRFSLFNTARWGELDSPLVSVVPTLYTGPFDSTTVAGVLEELKITGSKAAPGFMDPEGIVVYHKAANSLFKVTFDDAPKGGPDGLEA